MALKFNKYTLTFSFILYIYSFFSYSQNLYWAGFAFIGNKDQNFRYPVAISIFEKEKSLLSRKLKETLKSLKRSDVNIIFDQGKISSGDAKALAFGVMDESLERIITEYGISTHYSIYGQVMIFDFNDKRMIANYPVLVRYTSITDEIPSKESDIKQYTDMYLNLDSKVSVFNQWLKMFEKTRINEIKNKATIGVGKILYGDEVKKSLPDNLKKNEVWKTRIAQKIEYNIASQHNVPLVPYTTGEAIGAKGSSGLFTRFTDSVSKVLTLPDKDFLFDVRVKGFRYKMNEGDYEVQHIWAAYIEFNLNADYGDGELTNLTNENFRYFSESRFSKKANVKILDQWAVNETILANLINKFVVQIKTKDEKEIKSITDTEFKDVKNKFTKIEEVFKKCM